MIGKSNLKMEGAGDHKPKIEADVQNIINIKVQDQQGGVVRFHFLQRNS